LGFASTWIGVEANVGRPGFLQIGVTEGRNVSSSDTGLGLPVADDPPFFEAFWSDTVRHFHPVYLGFVSPGDVVHVSLRFERGRWWLKISDPRSALHLRFSTAQEQGPMTQADWLQEDVLNQRTYRPFPYPRLSAITVGDLEVNGAPPEPAELSHSAHMTLTASPIRDDTFTLQPSS
jgi:hypothetical protein